MDGTFSIMFSYPEAALRPGFWRRCFTSGKFHDNFQAVVVDEAHCMTEWYVLYIYLTLYPRSNRLIQPGFHQPLWNLFLAYQVW
jgi:hypothetical protein